MTKKNILIFGTGRGSKEVEDIIDFDKVNILAYLDNDKSKQGTLHNGYKVIKPNTLNELKFDYIVIGSMFFQEIKQQLLQLDIPNGKIVKILKDIKEKEKSSRQLIKEVYKHNQIYSSIVKKQHLPFYYKSYGISDMGVFSQERNLNLYNYPDHFIGGLDFVRVSTVELLTKEIYENNIKGEVAELGVYRGDFSKLISDCFPDRKLYLFDTFEGFSENDIPVERDKKLSNVNVGGFGDTTIELVKNKIDKIENIIFKKGYFPESAFGLEEEFAFVSIDVDLYKPTYEGLHYFYNRLSKGGYILVHDFNHPSYKGVKLAVKNFCTEIGLSYVPVSDFFGSVIITKN